MFCAVSQNTSVSCKTITEGEKKVNLKLWKRKEWHLKQR